MIRSPTTALLAAALVLSWSLSAAADDDDDGGHRFDRAPISDIYAFGDSLTDTGNLFALTGGLAPPSPPFFNGRFSDGPVWIERLGPLLGLEVDFDTNVLFDPLSHNQAVAGAFTDTRNVNAALVPSLAGTGILGQIARFEAAGGHFRRRDLVVVWGGANGGALFWDLIHPSSKTHALIAFQAFGAVTGGNPEGRRKTGFLGVAIGADPRSRHSAG